MKNSIVTTGIVLARINYQEADRIITVLSSDRGKLRLMAKGVRRAKSKMAGGIELFSVSEISYLPGKGELGTLVSCRLSTHYSNIVKDVHRTMFGYEILKKVNKITEEVAESEFFDLVKAALVALDNHDVSLELLELWFNAQLLKITGHQPNLLTTSGGKKLLADSSYGFNYDDMSFEPQSSSAIRANHIKLLRLVGQVDNPAKLLKVGGLAQLTPTCLELTKTMLARHIRL